MKRFLSMILLIASCLSLHAQQKTQNLVVVTLDGMRWQEVFGGADSTLINDSIFTSDRAEIKKKYWAPTREQRREKLFPFLWNTVAKQGQIYGNRWEGNKVSNANRYWFSYPGYNEIFTGYPDTLVNSNDKILNKNENVLEFLNKQAAYKGKVAAFTSWDTFDAILNENRSGINVSSGVDSLKFKNSPQLQLLDEMQKRAPMILGDGVRPDFITYYIAREYMAKYSPRVLYIAFDETDDYAHGGKYDMYLNTSWLINQWLMDLWNFIQSNPVYKNKTTILITTDHGRGDELKSNWRHHGEKISDAYQIWIAAMGPDTAPLGEIKTSGQLYQAQIAATLSALLGYQFKANHPVAEPIQAIYKK